MDQINDHRTKVRTFSADDLRGRADGILTPPAERPTILVEESPRRSDFDLNPDMDPVRDAYSDSKHPAAVLIPIVDRRPEATILLTQRTSHLRSHAGQIAFPGGRMEEGDISPAHTALARNHRGDRYCTRLCRCDRIPGDIPDIDRIPGCACRRHCQP